jgi:hypothetical protein
VLTGGGFANGPESFTYSSYPLSNGIDWQVCAQNDSNSTGSVAALGVCLALPGATVTRVIADTYFAAGTSGTATASCPPNTRVSGNGFYISPSSQFRMLESDSFTTSSRAMARGTGGTRPGHVQAIASCLSIP